MQTLRPAPSIHHCTSANATVCAHRAQSLPESNPITETNRVCAPFLRKTGLSGLACAPPFGNHANTAATLLTPTKKIIFISPSCTVSPGCDCTGYSDAPICPDLGLLGSWDPVALDQACLDLVNLAPPLYPSALPADIAPGQDKFAAIHNHVRGQHLLEYACALGLGHREYALQPV